MTHLTEFVATGTCMSVLHGGKFGEFRSKNKSHIQLSLKFSMKRPLLEQFIKLKSIGSRKKTLPQMTHEQRRRKGKQKFIL